MKIELTKFKNRENLAVKGIFLKPGRDVTAKKTGVVYLAGSVLGSTAVHRLGIDVVDLLSAQGYCGYIFDHSNTGESEGSLESGWSNKLIQIVIDGHMVDDTLAAIENFKNTQGIKEVVLIGHCGGGLTALYTASRLDCVKGVVLISTPILWEGDNDIEKSAGSVREYSQLYKRKLLSLDSWKKLFTGKTDYGLLFGFLKNRLWRSVSKKTIAARPINKKFMDAFNKVKKDKKMLFIMGDRDPGVEEYKSFAKINLADSRESRILKDTSHGFVTHDSMELLFREIGAFIEQFG
jgi:pimeloyl-ACP methyl ester carboxylesterase